jgi:hypothetical protein
VNKPTDLELMLFADGELDEPRREQIEEFLLSNAAARDKMAALRVVGAFVGGQADDAPSFADAIMARIDQEGPAATARPDNVIPLHGRRAPSPKSERAPASGLFGRTSRAVYYFAAVAVAAAAAMTLWIRVDPQMAALPPTTAIVPMSPAAPGAAAALAVEPAAVAALDPEVGVEVAAVDFGTRSGTVFYVQGDDAAPGATTTVVWVNDSGEE